MSKFSSNKSVKGTKRGRPRKNQTNFLIPTRPPAEQQPLFKEFDFSPRIIPRPDHCVSRKEMDREALKVLYRLKDHGYIAYLVGGSVRDLLLGRRPKDFDISTNATPREIRRLFHYSRIIGKRFRLVHVYFKGGKVIEVSTFRRQTEYNDLEAAREGIDESDIFGSPQEDAFRRDLTINGLFYNIADFSIIDYVGGMEDLRNGIIRTIGDPDRRFLRDPVRMMRAVRHAARTGFQIEERSWEAILRHKDMIRFCAIPRVRDEWLKDLRSGSSHPWAHLMFESGLFDSIFPMYCKGISVESRSHVKKLLLGLLSRLDQLIQKGEEVQESFMLALFIYPRLSVMPEWKGLETGKIRWATYEVRALINELLEPYDFKRSVREGIAQLLSSQWPIRLCHKEGSWPKRVWSKANFPEALMLYNFIQEVLGLPLTGPVASLKAKKRHKSRPRKRRTPKHRLTDS